MLREIGTSTLARELEPNCEYNFHKSGNQTFCDAQIVLTNNDVFGRNTCFKMIHF